MFVFCGIGSVKPNRRDRSCFAGVRHYRQLAATLLQTRPLCTSAVHFSDANEFGRIWIVQ